MKPVYLTMEEIAVLKSLVNTSINDFRMMSKKIDIEHVAILSDLHRKLFMALTQASEGLHRGTDGRYD